MINFSDSVFGTTFPVLPAKNFDIETKNSDYNQETDKKKSEEILNNADFSSGIIADLTNQSTNDTNYNIASKSESFKLNQCQSSKANFFDSEELTWFTSKVNSIDMNRTLLVDSCSNLQNTEDQEKLEKEFLEKIINIVNLYISPLSSLVCEIKKSLITIPGVPANLLHQTRYLCNKLEEYRDEVIVTKKALETIDTSLIDRINKIRKKNLDLQKRLASIEEIGLKYIESKISKIICNEIESLGIKCLNYANAYYFVYDITHLNLYHKFENFLSSDDIMKNCMIDQSFTLENTQDVFWSSKASKKVTIDTAVSKWIVLLDLCKKIYNNN